jgi:hypothetical protein
VKCSGKRAQFAGLFFMTELGETSPEIVISSHSECPQVQIDPISSNEGVALRLLCCRSKRWLGFEDFRAVCEAVRQSHRWDSERVPLWLELRALRGSARKRVRLAV